MTLKTYNSVRCLNLKFEYLESWLEDVVDLCQPDQIVLCDGTDKQHQIFLDMMVDDGQLIKLNEKTNPNSYLYRSHPSDVARSERLTYICTDDDSKDEVGANNNWMNDLEAHKKIDKLFEGSMKGRTMYVVPYCMGSISSDYSQVGLEITDSLYVAVNMKIMTRMGLQVWNIINNLSYDQKDSFVKGIHCTGDLSPERRFIMHFPKENTIKSVGSGYGGNALLGKKCHALRLASYHASHQNWLAEHMLILGIEAPTGQRIYVAAAFPSACGKTNLAMLIPKMGLYKGWSIYTVGDDIAWLHPDKSAETFNGINPEAGFFGVVPGTSSHTNPNAFAMLKEDVIFTNVGLTDDNQPWWPGKDDVKPRYDWQGNDLSHLSKSEAQKKAAHPNARFTVSCNKCPSYISSDDEFYLNGVPISAILFGSRRSSLVPLVYESYDWVDGVLAGVSMCSETTAAAEGNTGVLRHDPMAMKPFCGYDYGLYFDHWIKMGKSLKKPPQIFHVNWFLKDEKGEFMWPGFGDNMRVLEWIYNRVNGQKDYESKTLGKFPYLSDINLQDMDDKEFTKKDLESLLSVDNKKYLGNLYSVRRYLIDNKFDSSKTLMDALDKKIQKFESELD